MPFNHLQAYVTCIVCTYACSDTSTHTYTIGAVRYETVAVFWDHLRLTRATRYRAY